MKDDEPVGLYDTMKWDDYSNKLKTIDNDQQ